MSLEISVCPAGTFRTRMKSAPLSVSEKSLLDIRYFGGRARQRPQRSDVRHCPEQRLDNVRDPDPAASNVARPTGNAGAELLLAAAAVQDVDESADAVVAPDDGAAPGQQHTGNHRKRRRRKPGTNSKARSDAKWRKNK